MLNVIVIPMTSWLSQQFEDEIILLFQYFFTVFFLCGNATNIWELVTSVLFKVWRWRFISNGTNDYYESYPIAKKGWHKPFEWVDCRTYASPPLEAILWIIFLALYFYINIPLGIIATLDSLSFVRSPKYGEKLKSNQVDG
jgi:DHA2 family multidrug resistance protein